MASSDDGDDSFYILASQQYESGNDYLDQDEVEDDVLLNASQQYEATLTRVNLT